MQLLTFDEILTKMCDTFDELIMPETIARSNTNVVYLIFKAIAKGYEIINNICVTLSHKFDPANCSSEDLESVSALVGTERLSGSATGLEIIAKNTAEEAVTLYAGMYSYALDDDTSFIFEVITDTVIGAGDTVTFLAMSENIGTYPVTAQAEIEVKYVGGDIDTNIKFSCDDNSSLLGVPRETDLAFRERILSDTTRQDTIKELEIKLKNLPYLFDAKVVFNNTSESRVVTGYTLPPFTMLIFYSGSPRTEIAEVVASSNIYPTLSTPHSIELRYVNSIFIDGYYPVYITEFVNLEYSIQVNYSIDTTYISSEKAQAEIRAFLYSNFRGQVHKDYIKEEDIYSKLKELSIAGVEILNIDLYQGGSQVPYVSVPPSDIPYLSTVTFTEA